MPPSGPMTCQNSCGAPMRPVNGRRDGQGAVFHPQNAILSCDEGYTHLASGTYSEESSRLTQHCQATGQFAAWGSEVSVSATEPGRVDCVPVQCARSDPPANWQWSGNGVFDTRTPAVLECLPGYSSNGMEHASTVWSVHCGGDGSHSPLPEPCVPITHRLQCAVEDAVNGEYLANAHITVTDASGTEHTTTSNAAGIWAVEHVMRGTVTITVAVDTYTTMEYSVNVQSNVNHGPCDAALNPHLAAHSWRAVLTWATNPRDLDGHVTRHAGRNGQNLLDDDGRPDCPCSERRHLYWRQTWMRSMAAHPIFWWSQYEDESRPAARLDRDNVWGGGVPETITFFRLNTCEYDCNFVYRVWDYCSLPDAMVDESEALVRLYNAEGLHTEFHIGAHGRMHEDDGYQDWVGQRHIARRWDVFQLDASGGTITVEDCSSGNCPADQTAEDNNHAWC